MIKQLTQIGTGLVIEQSILDLLNITNDTPLEITADGDKIVIRPVH